MNTKELQLVTFEQAKRLKQVGFDWDKVSHFYTELNSDIVEVNPFTIQKYQYNETFLAPTVALALKWFRDTKGFFSRIDFDLQGFRKGFYWTCFRLIDRNSLKTESNKYGSYESAESALLDELLTILEKEQ